MRQSRDSLEQALRAVRPWFRRGQFNVPTALVYWSAFSGQWGVEQWKISLQQFTLSTDHLSTGAFIEELDVCNDDDVGVKIEIIEEN